MTDPDESERALDVTPDDATPVGPGWGSPPFDPRVVDFGHYQGHTVEELAESDPAFLYWLARHPSGTRYREEIARVLGARSAADY